MFRRVAFWRGRSGTYNNTGICARTLLVYLTLDGYQKFWLGDPVILENMERHSGCGIPPQKPSAIGFCRWKGIGHWKKHSCYEYTTLVWIYLRFLLLHRRELRWLIFNSDCTNACALNGLRGPMRHHWFRGFTQSLTLCIKGCQSLFTRHANPAIERNIQSLTTSSCWSWFEVNGQVKGPK